MTQDDQHLRLLSIFHYVVAGFAMLCSLFPTVHLAVGIAMASGVFNDDPKDALPIALTGWFLVLFASLWVLCGLAFSTCVFLAGRNLNARRRYRFCLFMACLECLFMPFGTVLGVFAIIMLVKEPVKAQFGVSGR